MTYHHRAALLFLTLGVSLVSTGATWPLNPLVTRNPNPPAAMPVECAEGLAPAPTPRVQVAEIPTRSEIAPAAIPAAPPSRTLRRTLEEAHAALTRNDRPAFDAALASARLIVRDYPPGGERTAAEETLRAYEDAAFVWDAQFAAPFFDQNSEAYARVSRYPGYAEAVRRGVFTDDRDRRFYPAGESRQFLARTASQRLGIRTPEPPTRRARVEDRAERPRSTPPSVAQVTPRRTTGRTTPRRAATNTRPRKSATPAITAPASPDPPAPARTVTESAPATPPAAAPTPAPSASPAAEGAPVEDTPSTTTTAASEPTTAPVSVPATPAPAEWRAWFVPAFLIAAGLGVLVVLFRVSK